MAAHKQPDSPAQNSKYSINVDNCTIDKLVIGDYNTVNDNRSGRSRPSSQESSPILDSGESPFTKESGSVWTIPHETMVRILFLGNEITGHSNRRTDLTQLVNTTLEFGQFLTRQWWGYCFWETRSPVTATEERILPNLEQATGIAKYVFSNLHRS